MACQWPEVLGELMDRGLRSDATGGAASLIPGGSPRRGRPSTGGLVVSPARVRTELASRGARRRRQLNLLYERDGDGVLTAAQGRGDAGHDRSRADDPRRDVARRRRDGLRRTPEHHAGRGDRRGHAARPLDAWITWPLGGFAATAVYLAVTSFEPALLASRGRRPHHASDALPGDHRVRRRREGEPRRGGTHGHPRRAGVGYAPAGTMTVVVEGRVPGPMEVVLGAPSPLAEPDLSHAHGPCTTLSAVTT